MKFTPEQIEYIKERNKRNRDILAHDPRRGFITFTLENQIMALLLEINKKA